MTRKNPIIGPCGVIGLGESGYWAARLLMSKGFAVHVCDEGAGAVSQKRAQELKELGAVSAAAGKLSVEFFEGLGIKTLVLSPGIMLTHPAVVWAKAKGINVIGEIEAAYRFYEGKIIAITGTNGKTTTCTMAGKMLELFAESSAACGNIGTAFSRVVMERAPKAAALEISSFQLQTCVEFTPDSALFLNFSQDHLDAHRDMDEYFEAKLRLFKGVPLKKCIIDAASVYDGFEGKLPSGCFMYSIVPDKRADMYADGWSLYIRDKDEHAPMGKLRPFKKMIGGHNLRNALGALSAVIQSGLSVDMEAVSSMLETFEPPRHRLETVAVIKGVRYINDSKSTNTDSLKQALLAVDQPVVLIAGGKDKHISYEDIVPLAVKKVRCLIAIGETREVFRKTFGKHVQVEFENSMKEAVERAASAALCGDTVLMSPGCSSFDMYENYKKRGDDFAASVKDIESKQAARDVRG